MQSIKWVFRAKQASDNYIASALVRDAMRGNGEQKSVAGFGESVGIAESVDDAADVEGIGTVAKNAKVIEKAKGLVDVAVLGAESVNLFGYVWF